MTALVFGILAGLALALPLGAIGVLLVQEGITRGWRGGLPSAAGVATVDAAYCGLAIAAGSIAAPAITRLEPWPRLIGAAVLIALGALRVFRAAGTPLADKNSAGTMNSPPSHYALFLGLTAINPATLLYFVALLPGLTESALSPLAQVAFVAGAGTASFTWQSLLVGLGAGLRRKLSADVHRRTSLAGGVTVIILGMCLLIGVVGAPPE